MLVQINIPKCLSSEPNYFFLHHFFKTAKSWSGCLVVSNKSFSFATE